jgi:hypothetical protein
LEQESPIADPVLAASDAPGDAPVGESVTLPAEQPAAVLAAAPLLGWIDETGIDIVRATRLWIQYGIVGFAIACIVIGAVEGLLRW